MCSLHTVQCVVAGSLDGCLTFTSLNYGSDLSTCLGMASCKLRNGFHVQKLSINWDEIAVLLIDLGFDMIINMEV